MNWMINNQQKINRILFTIVLICWLIQFVFIITNYQLVNFLIFCSAGVYIWVAVTFDWTGWEDNSEE